MKLILFFHTIKKMSSENSSIEQESYDETMLCKKYKELKKLCNEYNELKKLLKIAKITSNTLKDWEEYIEILYDILLNKSNEWYFKDLFEIERNGKKVPIYCSFNHVTENKEIYEELNALRIGVDRIIENLHKKGELDGTKYDSIRLQLNTLAIIKGYKPYYNIDIKEHEKYKELTSNYKIKELKDYPTCTYVGTKTEKKLCYIVSDLSEVCHYITSRYTINKRIHGKYDISPKGKCCGNPGDYTYRGKCENLSERMRHEKQMQETSKDDSNTNKKTKAKATDPDEKIKKAIDGLPELVDPVRENGKFRIENSKFHLTYSYHISTKEYLETMRNQLSTCVRKGCKPIKILYYSIVRETGLSKGFDKPHPHTHVAIEMNAPLISTESRCFDYRCPVNPPTEDKWCHPNIRLINNTKHFKYICETYHTKEVDPDTNYRIPGLIQAIDLKSILGCKNTIEINEMIDQKNPDKMHLSFVYDAIREKHKKVIVEEEQNIIRKNKKLPNLKVWQLVLDELCKYINRRIILAIVGLSGGEGKSIIISHFRTLYNVIAIPPIKSGDIAHLIMQEIKNTGIYPDIICLDAPRCYGDSTTDSIFALFETIKNERLISGKYDSCSKELIKSPTIVIFTNDYPDVTRLSMDRWLIGKINRTRFEHLFLGDTARELLSKQIEDQKIVEKIYNDNGKEYINNLKSLEKCMIWPVETILEGKSYIKVIDMAYEKDYMCQVLFSREPVTKNERESNSTQCVTFHGIIKDFKYLDEKDNTDLCEESYRQKREYITRPLYPNELSLGIYKIKIYFRPMTEEEIENKNYTKKLDVLEYESELKQLVDKASSDYINLKTQELKNLLNQ